MHVKANSLLFALSSALDCVERELLGVTTNHSKRVALVSARLCTYMGLNAAEVFDMASCAVLHDNALTGYTLLVGRDAATRLQHIEQHCVSGEDYARPFPFQGDVHNIILHHHENWDGSGFFQVQGPALSLRAAALRLADNTDLMLNMGTGLRSDVCQKAHDHIRASRESLYHPDLVDAFLTLCDDAFMADLADEAIDNALSCHIPTVPTPLTLEELLRACELFSGITDAKSPFTADHSRCVADKTARLAVACNLEHEHAMKLRIAAHVHDVGKLVIAPSILEKPAPLTPEEFAIMKGHVLATLDLLQRVPGLEEISQWAVQHHEKLDGSGYPYGLRADQLGFEGRLLSCADIYQALVENRPYRQGMSHDAALSILQTMAHEGKLDADIVSRMDAALS